MLYKEKTPRKRQKEICESWGPTTKGNWGRRRTSLQAKCVSHPLSFCPPSPILLHISLPCLSASGTSCFFLVTKALCPITFPFLSHTVDFIIPYPSIVSFISEFYSPHLQGAYFLLITSSQYEDLCASMYSSTTPSVKSPDNRKGKKKSLNLRKTRTEFAVLLLEFLWSICCLNIR